MLTPAQVVPGRSTCFRWNGLVPRWNGLVPIPRWHGLAPIPAGTVLPPSPAGTVLSTAGTDLPPSPAGTVLSPLVLTCPHPPLERSRPPLELTCPRWNRLVPAGTNLSPTRSLSHLLIVIYTPVLKIGNVRPGTRPFVRGQDRSSGDKSALQDRSSVEQVSCSLDKPVRRGTSRLRPAGGHNARLLGAVCLPVRLFQRDKTAPAGDKIVQRRAGQ